MKKYIIVVVLAFIAIAITVVLRGKPTAASKAIAATASNDIVNETFTINLGNLPPHDVRAGASEAELAEFAWNEFFALNWKSSYKEDGKRGNPSKNWNYNQNQYPERYPDLAVWETYNHRTELRPAVGPMLPFDKQPTYTYYHGYPPIPHTDVNVFNNLDENNEIGSCNVYAHVTAYDRKYQVLYQAKVNRDEYEYVLKNYPTKEALRQANINTFNNITKDSAYYPGHTSNCDCDPAQQVICLPCGGGTIPNSGETLEGAIEVKTAWRRLGPGDEPSRYFTRIVLTYSQTGSALPLASNALYGLIGLHIIHKTKNYPNFVFATFEQVDVEKSDMAYVTLDSLGHETGGFVKQFPRLHPITPTCTAATTAAWDKLRSVHNTSVWLNYRLAGVQGQTTNDAKSPNFFLANYVIESDLPLMNFRGSSLDQPFDGKANILYNGHGYSMGGCQGCHGVSQVKLGSDLSFLLDTIDKPVDKPDVGNTSLKLQRYVHALRGFDIKK